MKVTFNEFLAIANKLPISYYFDGKISIDLVNNNVYEAFFDPIARIITLNFKAMEPHFERMEDTHEIEKYIRSDLYHEISHVFMTPQNFYDNYESTHLPRNIVRDILNIFEDERMETLLATYYMGVDFKESIIIMNNYQGEDAKDAQSDFYYTVRFRHGKEKFLKRINDIISKYPQNLVNANQNQYDPIAREYKKDIIKLAEDIYREWYEENQKERLLQKNQNYDTLGTDGKNQIVSELLSQDQPIEIYIGMGGQSGTKGQTGNQTSNGQQGQNQPQNGEKDKSKGKGEGDKNGEENEKDKENKGQMNGSGDDAQQQAIKDAKQRQEIPQRVNPNTKKEIQKMLDSKMNKYIDNDLTKQLDEFFVNFVRKNKNANQAIRGYSGRLNPRDVGRKDWKIFIHKTQNGGIRGFDNLKINLFIDTSGSFSGNTDKVNTLLRSLMDLEQKYQIFSFDLITCQEGETLRSKNERHIQCGGGNDLDDDIWDIYNKVQEKKAFNVNIALFDGNAFSNARGYNHEKNFAVFNNQRNSIISDKDNKQYIEQYSPNSNNIFVSRGSASESYPNLLFKNILSVIKKALNV